MKTIILITTVFLSQLSLAGTGGGGVMAATGKTNQLGGSVGTLEAKKSLSPEIIFNLGKKDGIAKFSYGQLVNNEWRIQNFEIPETELKADEGVIQALENSKSLNDWAEIK